MHFRIIKYDPRVHSQKWNLESFFCYFQFWPSSLTQRFTNELLPFHKQYLKYIHNKFHGLNRFPNLEMRWRFSSFVQVSLWIHDHFHHQFNHHVTLWIHEPLHHQFNHRGSIDSNRNFDWGLIRPFSDFLEPCYDEM